MRSRNRGFTLLEAIVAIVILGILGGVVAVFIKSPIDAYIAQTNRAVLSDAADGAIRRVTRDVASALPNSLRSTTLASTSCIELLPVLGGGRYRYQIGSNPADDTLDFTISDISFDVLGQVRLGNLPTGTKLVAIYNLGIASADAYNADNTATITSVSTTSVGFSSGKKFPFASPSKAFSVIPSESAVYYCSGTAPNMTLYRTTQPLAAQMSSCPTSGGTLLVDHVSSCNFYYQQAVNARDGILGISLALTLDGETINLYEQVMVNNVP
jgi:MSHA biogenesis protein MshO